jgi:hypothetical protein
MGLMLLKSLRIRFFFPEKHSYENLDSLLTDPQLLNKNEKQLFSQYYRLREVLKNIER